MTTPEPVPVASRSPEAATVALAYIGEALRVRDAAYAACLIGKIAAPVCRTCGATASQNCGLQVSADAAFAAAVRSHLAGDPA